MSECFTATILREGINPYVDVPPGVSAALAGKGYIPVRGTINGRPFRSGLVPRGAGRHRLFINGRMRSDAGIDTGSLVEVTVERDPEPRRLPIPLALTEALGADPAAASAWKKLRPSRRNEILSYLGSLKRPESIGRNVSRIVTELNSGRWQSVLKHDPLPGLLESGSEALGFFARRDLTGERTGTLRGLWQLPGAQNILRKQRDDGSWRYPGRVEAYNNFDLLQTFRNLGILVCMYGMNRDHPAIGAAAGYVFSCQSAEGDIRGILGNQYMPYYHGAILELLIRAGLTDDARVKKGLDWLISMRQEDGGWMIPVQGLPAAAKTAKLWRGRPVPPDPTLPFSHLATGMALRPLAAHRRYRHRREVKAAAALLKARFFQADRYNDRKAPPYWTKFQYPPWWTDIITGLEILSRTGFDRKDEDTARALEWFISNQEKDGLWPTGYKKGSKAGENRAWVGLAVCRVLRRFY